MLYNIGVRRTAWPQYCVEHSPTRSMLNKFAIYVLQRVIYDSLVKIKKKNDDIVDVVVSILNYIAGAAVPKPAGNWETPIFVRFSPAMYLISEAEMVL